MTKLDQIKGEIEQLTPEETGQLLVWLHGRETEDDAWDHQMKADADSGKFDELFRELDRERADGKLKEWP